MKHLALAVVLWMPALMVHAETPWEAYLRSPTSQMARAVEVATYTDPMDFVRRIDVDLGVVAGAVASGHEGAIDLAFRLRPQFVRSGHLSEYLDGIIGIAIRSNTKAYLRGTARTGKCIGIDPSGDIYVDNDAVRRDEREARIKALSTVSAGSELAMARICRNLLLKAGA